MQNKILNDKNIKSILAKIKKNKKKIVLCHGTFDLLHLGHIEHLKEASNLGDILIISVTSDNFVNKGPGRPINKIINRLKFLESLDAVDYVIESNSTTAIKSLKIIKPDVYCKGPDYKEHKDDITGKIKDEVITAKKINCKVSYTSGLTMSSSKIINEHFNNLDESQMKFVNKLKKVTSFEKISNHFELMKKLKILVIGEIIIDEYIFCQAIGKSGKESVLVIQPKKNETYLGGICQIANNLSTFSNNVTLLSITGNSKKKNTFINKNLNKKIKTEFFIDSSFQDIIKSRYIDIINQNKLLGVYKLEDNPLSLNIENKILKKLNKIIKSFDIVVLGDYGHGLITKKISKLITLKSKKLFLNSQINSSNIGYQSLKKYSNFYSLVINESELRHEFRDKTTNRDKLALQMIKQLKINNIIVTSGKEGAILFKKNSFKLQVPAFAMKVVDKVGSGDTMLSLISLCEASKMNNEEIMFISSLGAAQSVESIGNSELVDLIKLKKSVNYILK